MPLQPLPLTEASEDPATADRIAAAKAARDALARVLRDRAALVAAADADLVALIEQALGRITAQLAAAPSDYELWVLPRLMEGITRVLDELAANAAATASNRMGEAWRLGERLVTAPFEAEQARQPGGVPAVPAPAAVPSPAVADPAAGLGTPSVPQLRAMQQFNTAMIKGATGDTVKAINRALGQVVLGVAQPIEAIKLVSRLLPDRTSAQVRGIVNTNLASAFNGAAHAKMLAQAARDPALRKQWRRSGKRHSRANHDAADGQVVPVAEPFVLLPGKAKGDVVRLMYPCDPTAPVGETIHCGCVALPWKATWRMRNPGSTLPAKPAGEKPAQAKRTATAEQSSAVGRKAGTMTTQARILGAFAQAPTFRDVTGQRLVVDARLAPAGIGDARLTKAGTDLYSYHAVQTLRRPTEVWQAEHVDTASGEIVRTRIFLKRFTAAGRDWLGRAEFRREGDLWVPTGAYRAEPLAAGTGDQALAAARAGARVWPKRK